MWITAGELSARNPVTTHTPVNTHSWENIMEWIVEYCRNIGCSIEHFFRCAHMWRFGHDADVRTDAEYFRTRGTIPLYVEQYVEKIKEKCHARDRT